MNTKPLRLRFGSAILLLCYCFFDWLALGIDSRPWQEIVIYLTELSKWSKKQYAKRYVHTIGFIGREGFNYASLFLVS